MISNIKWFKMIISLLVCKLMIVKMKTLIVTVYHLVVDVTTFRRLLKIDMSVSNVSIVSVPYHVAVHLKCVHGA